MIGNVILFSETINADINVCITAFPHLLFEWVRRQQKKRLAEDILLRESFLFMIIIYF